MSKPKVYKRRFYNLENKKILWLLLLLLAAGFWFRTSVNTLDKQNALSPIVENVLIGTPKRIDSDTVEINGTLIRLEGYDGPNSDDGDAAAYFEEANATMDVAAAEAWRCEDRGKRLDGRIVAVCEFANGAGDIGLWIVSAGYGVDWPSYSGGRYAAAEAEARRQKVGMWRTLEKSWID